MGKLVRRFDREVAAFGDTLHIPKVSNLQGGTINAATGQLDAEAPTEGEVVLEIDQWKGVRVKMIDILSIQSKYPLRSFYTERMGYRLGQILEQALLGEASNITENVGTFNTDPADVHLRLAVQKLDDARVPFTDRHFVFKPAVKNVLLGIDKFVRYDAMGNAGQKGTSPIRAGQVPGELYGVITYVSPEVKKVGDNTSNVMFHRDWMALAIQKNIKVESFARTGWLDDFGASQLYGFKALRGDHAVEVRS